MRTVAVLIDAENVHASFGDRIFSYASSLGDVKAKEIYGVATALGLWVEPVLKYAIHPNLTIKASKFKNTSDISLVIGAMDLLIEGEVDTVIIVSSDSDFSTLSVRLRSAGIEVIGMGTDKVNPLWRTACSSFIVLSTPQQQARPAAQVVKPAEPVAAPVEKVRIPEKSAAVVPPVSQPVVVRTPDKVSKPVSEQEQKAVTAKKQGTPVIELPEPVKAAGSAAATQLKPARPRAAMTHSDRTSSIRNFITKQLEMNGGKMAITNIFHALNNLQDYHVDQQGSKRKPLNYLMWMFGDVFAFEDGMIMFPELSKGGKLKAGSQTETKDQTSEATGSASETGEAGRNPAGEEKPSGQPDNSGKDQQNAPVSPAPGTSGNANTSGGTVKPEGNPVKTPTEMKGVRPVEGTGTSGSPVTAASGTSSVRAAAEAEERPQGTAHEQNVMKPVAAEKPDKGREANDAPAQTAQLTAEPEATQKPESETETAPTQTAQPTAEPEATQKPSSEANAASAQTVPPTGEPETTQKPESEANAAPAQNVKPMATEPETTQKTDEGREANAEPTSGKTPTADPTGGEAKANTADAGTTEPDKRSQNKGGNRSGNGRKKQNESRGTGKNAGKKVNNGQKKDANPKRTEQPSQEKQPAEGRPGNDNQPKPAGTSEGANNRSEQKNGKNSEMARTEDKNPALENVSLGNIGIQTKPVKILMERGYRTLADVARVSDGELLRIKGIGQATVDQIRKSIAGATEK